MRRPLNQWLRTTGLTLPVVLPLKPVERSVAVRVTVPTGGRIIVGVVIPGHRLGDWHFGAQKRVELHLRVGLLDHDGNRVVVTYRRRVVITLPRLEPAVVAVIHPAGGTVVVIREVWVCRVARATEPETDVEERVPQRRVVTSGVATVDWRTEVILNHRRTPLVVVVRSIAGNAAHRIWCHISRMLRRTTDWNWGVTPSRITWTRIVNRCGHRHVGTSRSSRNRMGSRIRSGMVPRVRSGMVPRIRSGMVPRIRSGMVPRIRSGMVSWVRSGTVARVSSRAAARIHSRVVP